MTRLPDDFLEDRELRDAARRVVSADVAQLRQSLAEQGVPSRVSQTITGTVRRRIGAGLRDVAGLAQDQAQARPGLLAALGAVVIGALAVWFTRRPAAPEESAPLEEAASPVPGSHEGNPPSR